MAGLKAAWKAVELVDNLGSTLVDLLGHLKVD